jgi:hypothetical protein
LCLTILSCFDCRRRLVSRVNTQGRSTKDFAYPRNWSNFDKETSINVYKPNWDKKKKLFILFYCIKSNYIHLEQLKTFLFGIAWLENSSFCGQKHHLLACFGCLTINLRVHNLLAAAGPTAAMVRLGYIYMLVDKEGSLYTTLLTHDDPCIRLSLYSCRSES